MIHSINKLKALDSSALTARMRSARPKQTTLELWGKIGESPTLSRNGKIMVNK